VWVDPVCSCTKRHCGLESLEYCRRSSTHAPDSLLCLRCHHNRRAYLAVGTHHQLLDRRCGDKACPHALFSLAKRSVALHMWQLGGCKRATARA
jgi:hypothetical protein